jgi:hypothetical protein
MKECMADYSKQFDGQVGFEDWFPGITPSDAALKKYGEPEKRYTEPDAEEWYYADFHLGVESGIVTKIILLNETEILTLRNYAGNYGCPDAIFRILPSGELPQALIFLYSSVGLELTFATSEKVRLDDKPTSVKFFPPSTLDSYIANDPFLGEAGVAEPVPWRMAVH